MQKQGYGRIINTISRNAETNAERTSAYAAAKAGYGLQLELQLKKTETMTF